MTVTRTVQEAFIARAARAARATAKEYGVPAAVTLAQAALDEAQAAIEAEMQKTP